MSLELTNLQKAIALLESLENGDKTAESYINPNKYKQHNLSIEDGLEGYKSLMQNKPKEGFKVNIKRAFEDEDYVITHTDYDFYGPKIGFDVFRFEDGLIVEHWDNLTEKKEENTNNHSQIDGETEIKNHEEKEFNKVLVKEFIHSILIGKEYDRLPIYFFDDNFIQHDTSVEDGVANLQKTIQEMSRDSRAIQYDKNHLIIGEGNFVLAISEGKLSGEHTAFYDLFRVEGNNIKEHWDIRETILSKSKWKNNNGKFNFND